MAFSPETCWDYGTSKPSMLDLLHTQGPSCVEQRGTDENDIQYRAPI
jgi:hypothetical protein